MATEIIRLDERHAGLLSSVAEDVFDEQIDAKRLADYLGSPDRFMVVAVCDGVIVGQALAVIHRHPDKPTELYVDDLGVAPSFQRRGIATRLLYEVMRLGAEGGCKELWVATEPDNEVAQAFFRSLRLTSRTAVVFEGAL